MLWKLIVSHLVQKFPTFYGPQNFIIRFTVVLSYPVPDLSSPHPHTVFLQDPLLLSSHLRLGPN